MKEWSSVHQNTLTVLYVFTTSVVLSGQHVSGELCPGPAGQDLFAELHWHSVQQIMFTLLFHSMHSPSTFRTSFGNTV
ncbi:hypothetical protein EDC04DRAFT_2816421 [Pisolithus marmoratus]|nr:hypothetical protein EDC04DRAFT_2816421 [Pisolithus marmoratus]